MSREAGTPMGKRGDCGTEREIKQHTDVVLVSSSSLD